MRTRISIRGFVRPLVGRLVRNAFVKIDEKWTFTASNLDSAGRGGIRDKDHYHFVIFFVQKVNFGLFRGAILGLFEAYTFDNMSIYEAWPIVWLNHCPFSLKYHRF